MSHGTPALHARSSGALNEERLQAAGLGFKLSTVGRLRAAARRAVRAVCRLSIDKVTVNKGNREGIPDVDNVLYPNEHCLSAPAPVCTRISSSTPSPSIPKPRRTKKPTSPTTRVPNRRNVILWQETFLPLPRAPGVLGDLRPQPPVVDYRVFESGFRGPAGEDHADDATLLLPP